MEPGLNHWADIVVLIVYFISVIAVGLWTLFRPNRGNVKSFFLAGRDISWWPVGASLYASNIGSEHFIGLAGTGAATGIAIVMYEWMSLPLLLLLSWVFLPVYISAGVYTLPEYLQKRFGGERLRIYISCLALLLYVVTKIAVCIYAGALFIKLSLGWDMYVSIGALLAVTCVYTVLGGLAAVIYTDALQTLIMTVGATVLTVISFIKIGGYNNFKDLYMRSVARPSNYSNYISNSTQCGLPRDDAFHLFRHPYHSDNPWPGLLLQSSLGCVWYWCADQVIVQRTLAAKNISHAKGGSILAGYLKLLPLFLMIFPGMISRILFPDEIACIDPEECRKYCDNDIGCSNIAYPKLVIELLPIGLRGLLLAAMMSAIMGSLTSIFNSASTLFTIDIYRKIRPLANQREQLIVGRVFIVILCGVSILWIPLVQSSAGGQLFIYIQSIQGYLGTPIGLLFTMAIFWRPMNEQGAFWGLLTGHVIGLTRMVLDFVYPSPACGQLDNRPAFIANLHYTYFSQLNLIAMSFVIVVVSKLTSPPDVDQLIGVTWWTRKGKSSVGSSYDVTISDVIDMSVLGSMQQLTSDRPNGQLNGTSKDSPEVVVKPSVWRRYVDAVCGLPSEDDAANSSHVEVTESEADRMALLDEKPFWRQFLNANAVIGLIVVAFLFGVYI